ncbi:FAD-dependent monooxygenase mdpD [Colletotrichum fructicola]|nr:FAD-dependent monooxygenase mdpD [Colletotrichum fructicola]KAF5495949.1 FAD-dependent monooxygenase mdpD [Colletotrichum fructicola]
MSDTPIDPIPFADKAIKLDIVVVGHGIAGLVFAIDAKLRGHQVQILEKRPGLDDFGDVLALQASSLRSIKNGWPGFWDELQSLSLGSTLNLYRYDGTFLASPRIVSSDGLGFAVHRLDFHALLHQYALKCGVIIKFSMEVDKYLESPNRGAVVLSNGVRIEADLIVAADGVGSKSWDLVRNIKDQAVSSGYSVSRSNFPASPALENSPVLADEFQKSPTRGCAFMGPDTHIVMSKSRHRLGFLMTHKDPGNLPDTVPISTVLPYVEGWSPVVTELIKAVPDGVVYDWKLRWRDPQPGWVSPLGRLVQIGDAAHAFLPTSGYGASMAMEDAHSLVECLSHVEQQDIALALRVHNCLRFERTACAQKMGFKARELWHKTDWNSPIEDPTMFTRMWAPWLLEHDPEDYARKNFATCAQELRNGEQFQNSNSVPGYKFKMWTVRDLAESTNDGLEDEGEWFATE